LTAEKRSEVTYTVVQNDTLLGIAVEFEMTVPAIYALNPHLDEDPARLRIGTVLTLSRSVPFLSVRSVAHEDRIESTEKPDEEVRVDNQPASFSRIIQQSKKGSDRVTYEIIRINGIMTEEREIARVVVEEALAQITEVGTR
jgi:LysM repeat protein